MGLKGEDMLTTILLGGITHHYIGSSLPYCNRLTDFGTITNPCIAAMVGSTNAKAGFIAGKDSACGNIVGPVASFYVANNLDFVVGGYNTNFKKFHNLGIEPPSFIGLTPIIGLDYKININKNVSLDTIMSVGIVSHALSISF